MKKLNVTQFIPNIIIFVLFIVAAAMYFTPAIQGKVIYAGDNINGTSACREGHEFKQVDPEGSWWTGSMFSGMPNYQVGGHTDYLLDKILKPVRAVFTWGYHNSFGTFLFYLIAFFLLFRAFSVDKWLSMAGAFATAMSSYFFIIIAAQHNGKCFSITWMTLVVIGFLLIYKKQYGWGAILTMFFTYIGFFQHPQMSYYICLMISMFFFAELALAIKNKEMKHFALATAIFALSLGVGFGMGSANLFANQEYTSETMRGGHSDIVKADQNAEQQKGLDFEYATTWSYGIDETMTFLIPNYMGGASGYNLGKDSQLEKDMRRLGVPAAQAKGFCQSAPTFWGDKPFTSGPVYMGAIICFLFLLGLLIVPGPYKWALLAATLFSVFLGWGRHFEFLTQLFFDYFPMYNKFRAVESILIVAEIAMPILAFLAIKELAEGENKSWHKTAILIAGGITGAICLFVALFSGSFDVTAANDAQWKAQVGDQIYGYILDQRHALMSADAWRSLLFIALSMALIYWYAVDKKMDAQKRNLLLGCLLTVLVVADMWPVNKRYCNDDMFVTEKKRDQAFAMQPYEQQLLASDPSYFRVINLTTNTFNEARTSYYLKSVGGYSAAKLRRYQDIIDEHIAKNNMAVLNMLNTKYFIQRGQDGQPTPILNPNAFGNCWLVDRLVPVTTANAESDSLRTLDLRHVAVFDETFDANANILKRPELSTMQAFDEERIEFVSYAPNRLEYKAQVENPRTAVFSEIYYPYGWKATIDGEPTEIFRVNYILRAINLPAGEHDIVFYFAPDSVAKGNMLALVCFCIMLLTLCGKVGYDVYQAKKKA